MAGSSTLAVVLDCDGVLADTERYGHLAAFNQTFAEFGLPVRWGVAEYREKVRIGGGKERMASLLTPEFVAAAGLPADPGGQQAAIAAWHRRKTEIYTGLVASGAVPPRPGIEEHVGQGHDTATTLRAAAVTAREQAEATRPMQAMRGRASYTGERSIGTLDAGAVAVAVMFEALADLGPERPAQS